MLVMGETTRISLLVVLINIWSPHINKFLASVRMNTISTTKERGHQDQLQVNRGLDVLALQTEEGTLLTAASLFCCVSRVCSQVYVEPLHLY